MRFEIAYWKYKGGYTAAFFNGDENPDGSKLTIHYSLLTTY
jgi:hypothetical protein